MADVCVVYGREDESTAADLQELLSKQYDVWWDEQIVGRFAEEIERELPRAGCVVALFSASSRVKDTFGDELRLAQKHNIPLLPVRLDQSDPPYSFGSYSYVDFQHWDGSASHPAFRKLLKKVAAIVPPRKRPCRPPSIVDGVLTLPSVFFSVSSHETQLEPTDAMQALRVFGATPVLVSAYDLDPRREPTLLLEELKEYRAAGGFVLLDSGNYEASRLADSQWTVENFAPILQNSTFDRAFAFDVMNPALEAEACVEQIVHAVTRDQAHTSNAVFPIVHAPKMPNGGNHLEALPTVIREVSKQLEPELIAVPERELGAGIIARALTVRAIREELGKLPWYQPLHILGTGNPWSIAVLAAAGADTFDGLEWCRVAMDADTERIHHFQHFDFFADQANSSALAAALIQDPSTGFGGKVAFHNLNYFRDFTRLMQQMFADNAVEAFLAGLLGKKPAARVKESLPGCYR